jgi:hypothetical protein
MSAVWTLAAAIVLLAVVAVAFRREGVTRYEPYLRGAAVACVVVQWALMLGVIR